VGPVTKHAIGTLLAGAEVDRTVFWCSVGNGRKSGAFMGTIAEWLRIALAARAPVVGLTSFNGDSDGGVLGDFWFVHCDGNWIFVCGTCVNTSVCFFLEKTSTLPSSMEAGVLVSTLQNRRTKNTEAHESSMHSNYSLS